MLLNFIYLGHPRPFRNTHCLSSTHNAQAILLVLRKSLFHVRPIVSTLPSYSNFHSYHYHSTLASDEAATNLASLNPIVDPILEHPHE